MDSTINKILVESDGPENAGKAFENAILNMHILLMEIVKNAKVW